MLCKCAKCDHQEDIVLSEKDIAFAKSNNSDSLAVVWICPECGADNLSTVPVSQ